MWIRRRRLPHWDRPGQSQFVTFRLRDSLPAGREFPAGHVSSGVAFSAMDRLLDGARSGPSFLRQAGVAQLVKDSIERGVLLRQYELHSWVIMPNHVHLLITPLVSLSKALRSMKSAIAKGANELLFRRGQGFWQKESYDHLVRNAEEGRRIRRYIEENPVKAGIVATAEEYPWSSATAGTALLCSELSGSI